MRLIDADRLMQGLYAIRDRETGIPRSLADWFLSMVDETPTIQQGIDKDRLIEFLKKEHEYWEGMNQRSVIGADCGSDAIGIVLGWVNQQPTTDGWIPVSERLPDENMWCLVTYQSGEVEKVKYCTTNNWGQNDECITAWQPLPQPYKESE